MKWSETPLFHFKDTIELVLGVNRDMLDRHLDICSTLLKEFNKKILMNKTVNVGL